MREVDPYAQAKYQILLEALGPVRGVSVLVVGSGSGEFAALLARAGAQVTALDVDQATVDLTLQTARRFGVAIEGVISTLGDFKTTKSFDRVAATDVIEHIADDRSAFRKLIGLCKPGGKIVVTVPALPCLFGYHDEILGHYRRYTTKSLLAVIPPDVTIHLLRYYGLFLIPVAWLISRILRRPYPVSSVGQFGKRSRLGRFLVRAIFQWETCFRPPIGTSLLLIARAP